MVRNLTCRLTVTDTVTVVTVTVRLALVLTLALRLQSAPRPASMLVSTIALRLTHSQLHPPPRSLPGCDTGGPCFNYWGIFVMDLVVDAFFTVDIFVNFRSAWINTGHTPD